MKLSKSTSIYLADFFVFASSAASSYWLATNFHILSWPKIISICAAVGISFLRVIVNAVNYSSIDQFDGDWRNYSIEIHSSLFAASYMAKALFMQNISIFNSSRLEPFLGWGVYAIVWYTLCNLYHTNEIADGMYFHPFGENIWNALLYSAKMLVIAPLLQSIAHEMCVDQFLLDMVSYLVGVYRHDTRYYG